MMNGRPANRVQPAGESTVMHGNLAPRIQIDVPLGTPYREIRDSILRQAWELAGTQLRAAIALGITPETVSRTLRRSKTNQDAQPSRRHLLTGNNPANDRRMSRERPETEFEGEPSGLPLDQGERPALEQTAPPELNPRNGVRTAAMCSVASVAGEDQDDFPRPEEVGEQRSEGESKAQGINDGIGSNRS